MANVPPTFAEHLLPGGSGLFSRIVSAATNTRIRDIPVPLKLLNDPYNCPVAFLDHLAFEVGVDVWNEEWDDLKKRSVIATTIRTKEILGTVGGIKAYIGLEDAALVDYIVPPQTPYVSQALNGAALIAWLGQLPQLRVYYANETGQRKPGQSFVGSSYVGDATLTPDTGRDLLGRHAFFFDPITGAESPITLESLDVGPTTSVIAERAYVPGVAAKGQAFVGSFVGNCYISDAAKDPKTVTYNLVQDQSTVDPGVLALSLGAAFGAVNTQFERIPVMTQRKLGDAYVGVSCIGDCYLRSSDAQVDFYDRIYLADPTVMTPATTGSSYIGYSRLGLAPYTALMLIDAQETLDDSTAVIGKSFIGMCFVQPQDNTKRDRILRAIELSKAGRDRVYVDFQTTKVLTFGDAPKMDGSFRLGQRIPRNRL